MHRVDEAHTGKMNYFHITIAFLLAFTRCFFKWSTNSYSWLVLLAYSELEVEVRLNFGLIRLRAVDGITQVSPQG